VPPLRERTEDLPILISHILQTLRIPGTTKRTIATAALQRLTTYAWPGNVRELRNVIERIILMGTGTGPITQAEVEHVLPKSTGAPQTDDPVELTLDEIEQRHILRVLDANEGNKTAAAKTLDIDYKTLLAKLKKFAIDK
jgi:two-component system response regulator AtoC